MKNKEEANAVSGGSLWESILSEVQSNSRVPDKTVLLLGRPGIGKRTLVQALLAHACPAAAADATAETSPEGHSRAVALDYAYFGGRDPDQDEKASAPDFVCPSACSVLFLEDPRQEKLLRSRLVPDTLKHCAAIICLDLKAPSTMMEDLRQFLKVLEGLTAELIKEMPFDEQNQLRQKVSAAVAGYREPDAPENAEAAGGADLSYNMGIPVIVVATRADGASALESAKTLGWSEFIEAYLRNACLPYGAALVYTMVQPKNTRNVDLLYHYLMHRLYGYPLKDKAKVPSRDELFMPSGWDTQTKVDAAASKLPQGGLDRAFESVVVSTEAPPPAAAPAVTCQDMQTFLKYNMNVSQKQGGGSGGGSRSTRADVPAGGAGGNEKDVQQGIREILAAAGKSNRSSVTAKEGGAAAAPAPAAAAPAPAAAAPEAAPAPAPAAAEAPPAPAPAAGDGA